MPYAPCKFIKRIAEFRKRKDSENVPDNTRGIYVLLREAKDKFDVVYIGMSGRSTISGIWARLKSHRKYKRNWTHFTLFEVHDNITNAEIKELEGLILCIYRMDSTANKHNVQLRYKPLRQVVENDFEKWVNCKS